MEDSFRQLFIEDADQQTALASNLIYILQYSIEKIGIRNGESFEFSKKLFLDKVEQISGNRSDDCPISIEEWDMIITSVCREVLKIFNEQDLELDSSSTSELLEASQIIYLKEELIKILKQQIVHMGSVMKGLDDIILSKKGHTKSSKIFVENAIKMADGSKDEIDNEKN